MAPIKAKKDKGKEKADNNTQDAQESTASERVNGKERRENVKEPVTFKLGEKEYSFGKWIIVLEKKAHESVFYSPGHPEEPASIKHVSRSDIPTEGDGMKGGVYEWAFSIDGIKFLPIYVGKAEHGTTLRRRLGPYFKYGTTEQNHFHELLQVEGKIFLAVRYVDLTKDSNENVKTAEKILRKKYSYYRNFETGDPLRDLRSSGGKANVLITSVENDFKAALNSAASSDSDMKEIEENFRNLSLAKRQKILHRLQQLD